MHFIIANANGPNCLSAIEPRQVWYKRLDHKGAISAQMSGHILKAPDLFVLGQQGEKRVKENVDQGELSLDGYVGEIAQPDRNTLTAGFGP